MTDSPVVSVWEDTGDEWAKIAQLSTFEAATYEPRHNQPGPWDITIPYDSQGLKITRDRAVTFDWRGSRFTGIVSQLVPSLDEEGALTVTASGFDALGMLGWSVAYPDPLVSLAEQPYHDPNAPAPIIGPAEDVLHQLIAQNMVARRVMAVDVDQSQHRGTTVRARPAFDNLLSLAALKAVRGGIGVRCGLVGTTGTRARMTVSFYEPADKSLRVRLSQQLGNLRSWAQTDAAPDVTQALVRDAGNRFRRVTTDESTAAAQVWGGHREAFVGEVNSYDADEVDQAGQEALDSGAATRAIQVVAAEASGLLALTHYNAGDRGTVVLVDGVETTDTISAITISINDGGVDVVPAVGDPDGGSPVVQLGKIIGALSRRTGVLERRAGNSAPEDAFAITGGPDPDGTTPIDPDATDPEDEGT